MPHFRLCRHLFTDGHQCGSPALRDEELCFYHRLARRPQKHQTIHGFTLVAIPEPLDLHAVQHGLAELIRLIAAGKIDTGRAACLHRALASASQNLARIDRQTARAQALDPNRRPVSDFNNHPTLGSLAPEPQAAPAPAELPTEVQTDLRTSTQQNQDFEASVDNPATPTPTPLPDYITPFTLAPEIENLQPREELERAEAAYADSYRQLAREVHRRTLQLRALPEDRFDPHQLPLPSQDPRLADALALVEQEHAEQQHAEQQHAEQQHTACHQTDPQPAPTQTSEISDGLQHLAPALDRPSAARTAPRSRHHDLRHTFPEPVPDPMAGLLDPITDLLDPTCYMRPTTAHLATC